MSGARKAGIAAGVLALVVTAVVAARYLPTLVRPQTVVVGVDLPFSGTGAAASTETWNAMHLYLDQLGGKVGDVTVELRQYDNSSVRRGTWDEEFCRRNARAHVANAAEIAMIGPAHAGCAKVQAPILNEAGLVNVSHAITNPGLTKTWSQGEPASYVPSGRRTFARVIATDDAQGAAAARYAAKQLGARACLVLDDGEVYGKGLAASFVDAANGLKLSIAGRGTWARGATSYESILTRGADCVFLAGNFDNNGERLIEEKVATLGDNDAVKLLVPDGFGGYPAFLRSPAAQGAYVTSIGLGAVAWGGLEGPAKALMTAYQERHEVAPASASARYGVLALQVVLAAIEASDATREGVRTALFEGSGIAVPGDVCVLGHPVVIDPQSGDIDSQDIEVGRLVNGMVAATQTEVG